MVESQTLEREVGGFDPHSPCCVLEQDLPPKSTCNTQEMVASARHD